MRVVRGMVAFLVGAVMAAALVSGHITNPSSVIGFLDVFGDWSPGWLMLFMMGCLLPYFILHRVAMRRGKAALAGELCVPSNTKIDAKLIGGAAIFGVGWGMVGVCPGPAFASIASGGPSVLVFVAAMAVGMYVYEIAQRMTVPSRAAEAGFGGSQPKPLG